MESNTARKKRIHVANAEISSELGNVITEWLAESRFSDRRKFPKSRLARIFMDTILSFE